jgi:hypothetical protein
MIFGFIKAKKTAIGENNWDKQSKSATYKAALFFKQKTKQT